MTRIGLIGAGNIGSQLARAAVANGYDVTISNSRGPETLTDLVAELGERAQAGTAADAAAADLVVLTIPLKAVTSFPSDFLDGKTVIDTNNYYPQRDGNIAELDSEETTTAEITQAHFPGAKIVKAFNHIYASALTEDGQPAGSENRRALIVAGDHAAAKGEVAAFIDAIGFDVVDLGPLSEGWRLQRDTPAYGPRRNADELRADAAAAKRYRDM